jgi:uncharacterized membrane protein
MTRWGYAAIALVLVMFAGSLVAQFGFGDRLPEKVPIHWNFEGRADGWVSKEQTFMVYYLSPTIMAGVIGLTLFVLPWISPRNFAVESFRRTYDYVIFLIAALFVFLHAAILTGEFQERLFGVRWVLAGIFLFFALIGNVLGKVKPNFWMGVRTPWTLADPRVWDRTHRVAAWTFVTVGVAGAVGALVGLHPVACFVLLIAGALWPVLYSLVLYKRLEREGKLEVQRQQPVAQE